MIRIGFAGTPQCERSNRIYVGSGQNPESEYETQIRQGETIIRRAFEGLSERQRQTLTLFFFEGYTLREISQHLQESLANIRHYYYRGLKHLKESLDTAALA